MTEPKQKYDASTVAIMRQALKETVCWSSASSVKYLVR
jgi:hypothetical protein